MALTGGDNECSIWRAFARRGLGFSASQGLNTSRTDGVEAFDMPPGLCGFTDGVDAGKVHKAGSAIPVRFALEGGNEGLDIFAGGYPASQQVNCAAPHAAMGPLKPADTPGNSSLTFSEGTGGVPLCVEDGQVLGGHVPRPHRQAHGWHGVPRGSHSARFDIPLDSDSREGPVPPGCFHVFP